MASGIAPSSRPSSELQAAVQNPASAPAPAGVGAAPDRIEPAPKQAEAPAAPGYFEQAAKAVKEFFKSIIDAFGKLFGCVKSKEPPSKEVMKMKGDLKRLKQNRCTPSQILDYFRAYFSPEQKEDIYYQIGRNHVPPRLPESPPNLGQAGIVGRLASFLAPAVSSGDEPAARDPRKEAVESGRIEAMNNPQLLCPELIAKLEELLT